MLACVGSLGHVQISALPEPLLLCPSGGKCLKIQLARESKGHLEQVLFHASALSTMSQKTCISFTPPQNLAWSSAAGQSWHG